MSSLLVDADAVQYGAVDERGGISLATTRSASSYDIIDGVLTRVLEAGGEVLAVSKQDEAAAALLPAAAILRWI